MPLRRQPGRARRVAKVSKETEGDLYPPIKAFLENQGYAVKGEIGRCDVVARRGMEDPVVVELKTRFSLDLVLQGVDRLKLTDKVYLAVAEASSAGGALARRGRDVKRLCRLLGLGLLTVRPGLPGGAGVLVHLDPIAYAPRQNKRRRERLLGEFMRRVGDPSPGGRSGRPVMTAYRQDALRCADLLQRHGPLGTKELRALSGIERSAGILQRDVYGWFERVQRGVYRLSPKGEDGLALFAEAVEALREGG